MAYLQSFNTDIWMHGMTSPAPPFYTDELLRKANQALSEGFGIRHEDISSDIS